ncbi:MAG TPA: SPASM domain-containing protein [Thermoanaerobaculia bacterium]|nr:SPASM domain-containing protein [Thermoanaerobaculia bacterium]
MSFGSLHENTIEEIWNGKPFRAFRAQHARKEVADGCASPPDVTQIDDELMIDKTPVANFHDDAVSRVEGSEFEMCVPVPFLTEGAHLLWTRSTRDFFTSDSREIYFWR